MNQQSPLRILLIEDSEHDIIAFNRTLEKANIKVDVTSFLTAEPALKALEQRPLAYDLVVADYKLPGMTGLELCQQVIAQKLPLPCVIITGAGDEQVAVEAMQSGVEDYLVKDAHQHYLELLPTILNKAVMSFREKLSAQIYEHERQTVAAISEMFFWPESLESLFEKIPATLAKEFSFPITAILLLTPDRKAMLLKGTTGLSGRVETDQPLPIENTVCGDSVLSGQAHLETNIRENRELVCFLKNSNVDTCLTIPIKNRHNRVIGTVVLSDIEQHPEADLHISALQVIANHLGQEIDRRQAEAATRKALQEWDQAMDASEDAIYILSSERYLHRANSAFYQMTNSTPESAVGTFIEDIVHPQGEPKPCPVCSAQTEQRDEVIIFEPGHPNNPVGRPLEITVTMVRDGEDKLLSILMRLHDLTQQRKTEDLLIQQRDQLSQAKQEWERCFDAIDDVITIQSKDMRILRANRAACDFFQKSYGEMIGRPCYEVFCGINEPCPGCPAQLTAETVDSHTAVLTHEAIGKTYVVSSAPTLDKNNQLENIIHVARDISDLQELQVQLRQKYKMEAVGHMAGGMAHNFNNNLSIILGNIELAKMKLTSGSELIPFLENAKIGVRRSRDLVQKILTYSRQGIQQKVPTLLVEVVDETIRLLQSTIPTTVTLQKSFSPDCYTELINADPSQIQEVLINLSNNAIQAMEEQGELTISLEPVVLKQKEIPAQYDQKPGRYAKLSVQDSGCGISPEILDKIFDPFFSTKGMEEGTGIGLATVQGIVTQHEGIIKVNSVLDQGTVFNLYFPIIEQTDINEPSVEDTALPRGTEHILFVDDDEMLANLGGQLLTKLGYQVSVMTESPDALMLFTANADRFDLVITDQTMPQLSGKDLIVELKKVKPDIPTILCTGYSSKIDEDIAKELGISAFMMKPLDQAKLAQTVRRVLDDGSI